MPRYRIEYSKTGRARWLSHLELIRTFMRALRRSGLPLVFSQGFNPHPRLSYGPSLGVGVAGLREYLDLELAVVVSLPESLVSLRKQFPQGLELGCLMELAPTAPGIGKAVNCAWYGLGLPPDQDADAWQQAMDHLVGGSLPITYKRHKDGKLFDVGPALAACRITDAGGRKSEACSSRFEVRGSRFEEEKLVEDRMTNLQHQEGDRHSAPFVDLLVDLGGAAVSLRGLVETLLFLAAELRNKGSEVAKGLHPTAGFQPALVTRMALLHHNGGLANPLGERKQLWEA